MRGRTAKYVFYSELPPEEVQEKMGEWVARENLRGSVKIKLRWKGDSFRLGRGEAWRGRGAYGAAYATSRGVGAGFGAGMSRELRIANPFYGRCLPDGAGGSILQGGIRLHGAAWGIFALVGGGAILASAMSRRWGIGLVAVSLLAYHLLRAVRTCGQEYGAQMILAFLEQHFPNRGEGQEGD